MKKADKFKFRKETWFEKNYRAINGLLQHVLTEIVKKFLNLDFRIAMDIHDITEEVL